MHSISPALHIIVKKALPYFSDNLFIIIRNCLSDKLVQCHDLHNIYLQLCVIFLD